MSTLFGVKVEADGVRDIIEIAQRSNGVRWTTPWATLLPDELEVLPLDNTPQGIYTIGDIRKEVEGRCVHPYNRLHWVNSLVFCNKCKTTLGEDNRN